MWVFEQARSFKQAMQRDRLIVPLEKVLASTSAPDTTRAEETSTNSTTPNTSEGRIICMLPSA